MRVRLWIRTPGYSVGRSARKDMRQKPCRDQSKSSTRTSKTVPVYCGATAATAAIIGKQPQSGRACHEHHRALNGLRDVSDQELVQQPTEKGGHTSSTVTTWRCSRCIDGIPYRCSCTTFPQFSRPFCCFFHRDCGGRAICGGSILPAWWHRARPVVYCIHHGRFRPAYSACCCSSSSSSPCARGCHEETLERRRRGGGRSKEHGKLC